MGKATRRKWKDYVIDRYFASLREYMNFHPTNEYVNWSEEKVKDELSKFRKDLAYFLALSKINYPSTHVMVEMKKVLRKLIKRGMKIYDLLTEDEKEFLYGSENALANLIIKMKQEEQ